MKILVCGSRHFYDWRLLEHTLNEFQKEQEITAIVHGGAAGADSLGGQYARYNNIPELRFPADWVRLGKRAGPVRNAQMLTEGKPKFVIAFRFPGSRGTQNMIDQATKAGIPVKVISCE